MNDPWSVRWWMWRHRNHGGLRVNRDISVRHITEYGILVQCVCGKDGAW